MCDLLAPPLAAAAASAESVAFFALRWEPPPLRPVSAEPAAVAASFAASGPAIAFDASDAFCSVVLAVGAGLKEFVPSARARFASTMVPAASLPAGALL